MYARSVCEGCHLNALACCQLCVNCPLEEGSHCTPNHKTTALANYYPHLTQYGLSSMCGPMLPNPEIASASSDSVKRAGAWGWQSHKTDSARPLQMAGNHAHPWNTIAPWVLNYWCILCRPYWILTKCTFGPLKLICEHWSIEPISMKSEFKERQS